MIIDVKMGQGVKRKIDDSDCERCPQTQRQSILDISVGKLHVKTKKKVEPPLLRSVLILNTLKHIESELLREGVQTPTNTSAFTIPEVDPNSTVIDFLPEQNISSNSKSDSQSGPLPSIDTFVGSRAMIVDSKEDHYVEKPVAAASSAENFVSSPHHSSPFRMEEVFSDFDFTMCDYDMFSSGTNLTPLSAEEVLHSFPNAGSNFSNDTFTTLSNASLTPFCKAETALDDLENIMQILVGS